jgi:hypothetical protein
MKRKPARVTDPYGKLEYAIGTQDDFWCFDFYLHRDGTVTLHAMINSESVHFIKDAEKPIRVPRSRAVEEAKRLTQAAIEWCQECGDPLTHDLKGWNQSPCYFWRSVHAAITKTGEAIRVPVNMERRPLITRNYL